MKVAISTKGSFAISKRGCEYLVLEGVIEAIELLQHYIHCVDEGDIDWHGYIWSDDENAFRTNPILIEAIEKFGLEMNAPDHEIKVVEIPDNIDWYIDENELSQECVREVHRTWC